MTENLFVMRFLFYVFLDRYLCFRQVFLQRYFHENSLFFEMKTRSVSGILVPRERARDRPCKERGIRMQHITNRALKAGRGYRVRQVAVVAALVAMVFAAVSPAAAQAASFTSSHHRPGYKEHPNPYHPPIVPAHHGPYPGPKPFSFTPSLGSATIAHPFKPSMHELVVSLTQAIVSHPGATPVYHPIPAHAFSSDNQLEVSVPANALTAADITAAGGAVRLVVDQIDGLSGSINDASGSGKIAFGSYEFQLQNAAGHEITLSAGAHQPLIFTYH
jgi:hypothetical protein